MLDLKNESQNCERAFSKTSYYRFGMQTFYSGSISGEGIKIFRVNINGPIISTWKLYKKLC